jgi:hypothetical protein
MKGQLFDIGVSGSNEYFFALNYRNATYLGTRKFEGVLDSNDQDIYIRQIQEVNLDISERVLVGIKVTLAADLSSFSIYTDWSMLVSDISMKEVSNFADNSIPEIQIVNHIIANYLVKIQDEAKELFVQTIPEKKILEDEFLVGYIGAAFFSSTYEKEESQNEGIPLDRDYGREDLEPLTILQMMEDCKMFQQVAWSDIKDDLAEAGKDFWNTRNGQGVGFWDEDWEKEVGKRLTSLSKTFDGVRLDVCEGKVYQTSA